MYGKTQQADAGHCGTVMRPSRVSDLLSQFAKIPPGMTYRRSHSDCCLSGSASLGDCFTCGQPSSVSHPIRANLGFMNDADRVARERARGKRDAVNESDEVRRSEEASRRARLLSEIGKLVQTALDAQKAAEYPDLETVEVVGAGERERGGFRLASFWMSDRGNAIHGADYLLGDGTLATSYEDRALIVMDNLDSVNVARLDCIRRELERLASAS